MPSLPQNLRPLLPIVACSLFCLGLGASARAAATPEVPEWAQPGSATHQQVPPPKDFRRASTTIEVPIGVFEGQTDVGSAVVPGEASFDANTEAYTIQSAGYNVWYHRDEFRFLWKKMSGDIALAAHIAFPNADGYFDRKAILIIRQDLDDDSKEVMVALHGGGLIHLAKRPEKGADIVETVRTGEPAKGAKTSPLARRLGIEKRGDRFSLHLSVDGEPMHPIGEATTLEFKEPFYVGIGFCSHLPATSDTAVLTEVRLENKADSGK